MKINGDIIKIAGEESVSKTIEELLDLNKLLPKRTKTLIETVQENQLDNTDNRGEVEILTEKQLKKTDIDTGKQILDTHKDDSGITEIRLNDKKNKQRRPEAFEETEARGHKSVSPLWSQIFKQEDDRKGLDKGQLDKKKK